MKSARNWAFLALVAFLLIAVPILYAQSVTMNIPMTVTVRGTPPPTPTPTPWPTPTPGGGGGGGGWYPTPTPTPTPTPGACQQLGGECAFSSDCCEGICVDGTCIMPQPTPTPEDEGPITIQPPGTAMLGAEIDVLVTDEEGNPVQDIIVRVLFPSREVQFFTTDGSGRFQFYGFEEGVYDYSVPGRVLSRAPSTNVFKPSGTPIPTPTISPSPTPPAPEEWDMTPLLCIAGAILLLLALLALLALKKRRKRHKKEPHPAHKAHAEKPHETAHPAHTQHAKTTKHPAHEAHKPETHKKKR